MYVTTPEQVFATTIVSLVCAWVFWCGGASERFGGAATWAAWLISPLFEQSPNMAGPQIGVFAIDVLYLGAMLALALRSDRFWPLWLTGFQTLEVIMHLARMVDSQVWSRPYFIGITIFSYLVLASLALGCWLEAPRRKAWSQRLRFPREWPADPNSSG